MQDNTDEQTKTAHEKLILLKETLKKLDNIAVAFSGGVDSTFLLAVAHEVLGDNVLALTAVSSVYPARESEEAIAFAKQLGVRHITHNVDELTIKGFTDNPVNRCYICKTNLFSAFIDIMKRHGFPFLAEGSNIDDMGDYRPGMQAVRELKALSPLRDAGLSKSEIRLLSREMALPTWDKPSFACLASRIPYGEKITREKLDTIDRAEQMLINLGFRQARLRHHGTLARIEVAIEELPRIVQPNIRERVVNAVKKEGFAYITLDLQGYRTGSMNETSS